jgi:hypothetical protein
MLLARVQRRLDRCEFNRASTDGAAIDAEDVFVETGLGFNWALALRPPRSTGSDLLESLGAAAAATGC